LGKKRAWTRSKEMGGESQAFCNKETLTQKKKKKSSSILKDSMLESSFENVIQKDKIPSGNFLLVM